MHSSRIEIRVREFEAGQTQLVVVYVFGLLAFYERGRPDFLADVFFDAYAQIACELDVFDDY